MSTQSSRRDLLRGAALTGIGLTASGSAFAQSNSPAPSGSTNTVAKPKSANDRIAFGCIGVGGKGDSDTADAARFGDIVAICDVDENTLDRAAKKYPNAKRYNDYRKMLTEMGGQIDAVTVSTPDHHHALAAGMAMKMGKHCYCQKPLTHSIYEARMLGDIARKARVATQMGNQGTADNSMRKNAYLVRAGALGTVKEVHVWTDRPIWPQGIDRAEPKPVPANLHWDLWLGPAPARPFSDHYHTFEWRGWWDFGTGALGDMACHTVNLPYMALDLRNPTSVEAMNSYNNRDSYPLTSIIKFEFPANESRPALTMYWYNGGMTPSTRIMPGTRYSGSGSLIVGDKGKLYTPGDYGGGGKIIDGVEISNVQYPESPGHWEEFIRAIRGGEQAMSNFPNYAGPLTETILLGNLAMWAEGKRVEWDAKSMKAKNAPEVAHIIKPVYHNGYSV